MTPKNVVQIKKTPYVLSLLLTVFLCGCIPANMESGKSGGDSIIKETRVAKTTNSEQLLSYFPEEVIPFKSSKHPKVSTQKILEDKTFKDLFLEMKETINTTDDEWEVVDSIKTQDPEQFALASFLSTFQPATSATQIKLPRKFASNEHEEHEHEYDEYEEDVANTKAHEEDKQNGVNIKEHELASVVVNKEEPVKAEKKSTKQIVISKVEPKTEIKEEPKKETKEDTQKAQIKMKEPKQIKLANNEIQPIETKKVEKVEAEKKKVTKQKAKVSPDAIQVKNIRFGQHDDFTRIVIESNKELSYETGSIDGKNMLAINLKNAEWTISDREFYPDNPIVMAYLARPLKTGGTRVVFKFKGETKFSDFSLPPDKEYKFYRYIIDVRKSQ